MKKFSIATMMMVLLLSITACHKDAEIPTCPIGAIRGCFSVNSSEQVRFSQGNLQYQPSTNTWRFAVHQYDMIGNGNAYPSSSSSGWMDLFGWGTSGYNGKYPYMTSNNEAEYGDYIAGTNYDWGVYNAISNGGNQAGLWRTLTKDEWVYVLNTRNTASGIRYAKACVNGVNGVILLPDYWKSSIYSLNSTNNSGASFSSNNISSSQWETLEQYGAVFLPAAGLRETSRWGGVTSVYGVGDTGIYWSASYNSSCCAYDVWFDDLSLYPQYTNYRYRGHSVRLVCPVW